MDEMKSLREEVIEIEKRIAALSDAHNLIGEWFKDLSNPSIGHAGEIGMTDRIREILNSQAEFQSLSPTHVRDILVRGGFSLEGRSNPMAEVHTVLRRLVAGGEATAHEDDHGNMFYLGIKPKKRRTRESRAS